MVGLEVFKNASTMILSSICRNFEECLGSGIAALTLAQFTHCSPFLTLLTLYSGIIPLFS